MTEAAAGVGGAPPAGSGEGATPDRRQVRASQRLIRRLPLFAELPAADIAELCRAARRVQVPAGELVMEEGTPGDGLYILLSGEIEVSKREGGQQLVLAVRGPGEFLGEMSLLEGGPKTASVRAVQDSELLVIEPSAFQGLLGRSPRAATTVLRTVASRLRSTEATLMQREKLASLGVLAAGLAHELNNPAAAIGRAAEHLGSAFSDWQRRTAELGALGLSPEQAARLGELEGAIADCGDPSQDALACSVEESRLGDWLAQRGLEESWDLASPLVSYGWTRERLASLAEAFPGAAFGPVVRWMAAGLEAQGLLQEIGASARAISDIVRAVKTYAYLDQAPVQEVDVRAGLEDTLVMLRHELKDGIRVVREFAPDLPRIEAYASELNQVWTNLIDNAIHAMGGSGTLTLRASRNADQVEVVVEDDGPGIPPDVGGRIFDPFFTTKPPGVGSGLGLHIAYNIVVNKHRGRITFESEPGCTAFRVTLPVRLRREEGPEGEG